MILNNLFDIRKPILQSLYEYADHNDGKIPDSIFSQCIDEYGADEDEVMAQMQDNPEYIFERLPDGFDVRLI